MESARIVDLLVQEKLTLYHFVDYGAHAVAVGARVLQNVLQRRAITEAHRRTRRVNDELFREITRDLLLVFQQQSLERAHIAEHPAIRRFTCAIDRQRVMECELLSAPA